MIVLIDNYDSFTYNLYQYLGELGAAVQVVRNDALSIAELEMLSPDGLVISPGPPTASSWACATVPSPLRECSSTQNRC